MDMEDNTALLKVCRYSTNEPNQTMGSEPDQPVRQAQLVGTDMHLGSKINTHRKPKLDFSKTFRKTIIEYVSWVGNLQPSSPPAWLLQDWPKVKIIQDIEFLQIPPKYWQPWGQGDEDVLTSSYPSQKPTVEILS